MLTFLLFSYRRVVRLSTGKLARMADGSCMGKSGDTSVIVTAVSRQEASSSASFMPLTVDYRQRAAAAGRIPTNFLRRELGPTETEILTGRMIDRSLRPVFPKGYFCETQIICNLLAVDGTNDPDVLTINTASAALASSDIPFDGPIAAIRVGLLGDSYDVIVNPTRKEMANSKLNLVVAGTGEKNILMMEGGTSEPIELSYVLKAIKAATKDIKTLSEGIKHLAESNPREKRKFEPPPQPTEDHVNRINTECEAELRSILTNHSLDKKSRDNEVQRVRKRMKETLAEVFPNDSSLLDDAFSKLFKNLYIDIVVETGFRCDGRTASELRPISCEVGLFQPLHGSGLFQRGQTQVLCSVALDSLNSVLRSDPISVITGGIKEKNFMLHYEFPPFATNEVGRATGMNRRELGHGSLAEKALRPLIPHKFPFTIRLTCDVLESNGSSSMASVCAGSLALMDAGVNIECHAAGVAMGLLKVPSKDGETEDSFKILTDILGLEDYLGEMDFKVAGTEKGLTAVQLDVKYPSGIPSKIIMEALQKGYVAKADIITKHMKLAISEAKKHKETWPVSKKLEIPAHKRSRFLGLGGIHIKKLTSETGVQVTEDLENSNAFNVFAPNEEAMSEADEYINKILTEDEEGPELEFGGVYDATIVEIRETGVMVTLGAKMHPTLLHNKELDQRKVYHPSALNLQVGQVIPVKYFGRDPVSGHLRISRRVLQMTSPKVVKQNTQIQDNQE